MTGHGKQHITSGAHLVLYYSRSGHMLHYGAICAVLPRNDGEREACRRLGRRLSEWVQVLICRRAEYDPRKATCSRMAD